MAHCGMKLLSSTVVLETKNIVKKFPGVVALKGVDFTLNSGEVHALVGQNGAGKSTFVKILNGILKPDKGEIYVYGRKVAFKGPSDAKRYGITLVHQEITLIPYLSIAENIVLSKIPLKIKSIGIINRDEMEEISKRVMEKLGLNLNPWMKVKDLSVGEQQLVQIARALAEDAKIICLDEPTSALTLGEIKRLFKVVKELKSEGRSIIYITHHISEVFEIADRVTVLRDGHKIVTLETSKTTLYNIVKYMLGREPEEFYISKGAKGVTHNKPILIVKGLTTIPGKSRGVKLQDISFELFPGEILGVIGLLGSGKTELGKALYGMEKVERGKIIINGREVKIRGPLDALKQGLFYLPENRHREGLVLGMKVRENIVLSSLKDLSLIHI